MIQRACMRSGHWKRCAAVLMQTELNYWLPCRLDLNYPPTAGRWDSSLLQILPTTQLARALSQVGYEESSNCPFEKFL
jgi:hypothetical protein